MRSREQIEKDRRQLEDMSFAVREEEQRKLILEILLDIRDLLIEMKSK